METLRPCPYCNEPADIDVTVGYTQIYCPRYSCDMPYTVIHPDKEEDFEATHPGMIDDILGRLNDE